MGNIKFERLTPILVAGSTGHRHWSSLSVHSTLKINSEIKETIIASYRNTFIIAQKTKKIDEVIDVLMIWVKLVKDENGRFWRNCRENREGAS